jgi:hypothetical protein
MHTLHVTKDNGQIASFEIAGDKEQVLFDEEWVACSAIRQELTALIEAPVKKAAKRARAAQAPTWQWHRNFFSNFCLDHIFQVWKKNGMWRCNVRDKSDYTLLAKESFENVMAVFEAPVAEFEVRSGVSVAAHSSQSHSSVFIYFPLHFHHTGTGVKTCVRAHLAAAFACNSVPAVCYGIVVAFRFYETEAEVRNQQSDVCAHLIFEWCCFTVPRVRLCSSRVVVLSALCFCFYSS